MNENFGTQTQAPVETQKMGWHKFLIYFSLWAGAAMNLFTAFQYFTGAVYGDEKNMVYRVFEKLEGIDKMMGVGALALVVLMIVARFALAGYKANGPKLLSLTYAVSIAIQFLYCVLAGSAVPQVGFASLFSEMMPNIIGSAVMLIINHIYYKKREELFVY